MDKKETRIKDKLWDRMLDMQMLGMTRQDLNDDNHIVEDQMAKNSPQNTQQQ